MFKTRITELLNIEHPIIKGGMMWISTAELAAAVSEAGGLGIVSAATFDTLQKFRAELKRARALTAKPLAVNLPLFPAIRPLDIDEYIRIMAAEGILIAETAGRNPEPHMETLKKHGVTIIHKTTAVRFALKAEKVGCDAVIMDGCECGGHPGEEDVTSLVLLPIAFKALKIPIIAAGGFGSGPGLAAALALGAGAVVMGTRFMLSQEAPMHGEIKRYLLGLRETDTTLILRSLKNTIRVARNDVADKILSLEGKGAGLDEIIPLARGERGLKLLQSGDRAAGILACGQVIGLLDDIPTVREIVETTITEAAAALDRARGV